MIFDSIFSKTPSSSEFAASQKEYATIIAIINGLLESDDIPDYKVDRIFNGLNFTPYGEYTCV